MDESTREAALPEATTSSPVLRRSRSNRMLAGVCGGLGRYLGIDPVIVRIALAVSVVAGFGTGLLLYLLGWILVPEERPGDNLGQVEGGGDTARTVVAVALIGLGLLILFAQLLPWLFGKGVIGALLLIAVGGVILFRGARG
jgi:phage shock protein C